MIRKLIVVVLVAIGAVAVIAFLRGPQWRITETVTVNAAPSTVLPLLTDFERGWVRWSVWGTMDPDVQFEVTGQPGTVGHTMTWGGVQSLGTGTLTLVTVEPLRVVFEGEVAAEEMNTKETITLQPLATDEVNRPRTEVRWVEQRKAWLVSGGFHKDEIEAVLADRLAEQLLALKVAAERAAAAQHPAVPAPTPAPVTGEPPSGLAPAP